MVSDGGREDDFTSTCGRTEVPTETTQVPDDHQVPWAAEVKFEPPELLSSIGKHGRSDELGMSVAAAICKP